MAITSKLLDQYRLAGINDAGLAYIAAVRAAPPARRVGGSRFLSVACRFPSTKMGCTIQAESRTGEYPLVLQMELDDDVIEFYDQPLPLRVVRVRNGRNHVSSYTPDFLVLRSTHAEVIEVKPRESVENAREKFPDDWAQREGRWVSLPIATQFDQLGIRYSIHLGEDIGAVTAANLNLLVVAKYTDPQPNEAALLKELGKAINSNKASTVQSLVADLTLKDASPVLRWIASGVLFAATSHQLLSDIRTARVFADEAAQTRFIAARTLQSKESTAPRDGHILSTDYDKAQASGGQTATASLTDRQLEAALARYNSALPAVTGERLPTRNERRQIKRMEAAVAEGLGPLHGFVPRYHKQGNRITRITPEQQKLMLTALRDSYATAARRSARWVHKSIPWGDIPKVGYKTFLAFTKKLPQHELAKARSGHRAWLAARPPSHPDVRAMWPTTAWELVHIDHTPIDEKVWGNLGIAQVLGRPWLTTMIDGWSHAALAFWLSFSPPSWQSLAMLLRNCVKRHNRLPIAWISDQGSEFGGNFWEKFSANHSCTKFDRAVADARCGSQVERSFHVLHRDLIYQLDGNMQNDREWRSATTSHKSDANARYLLERTYLEIEHYLFDYYNNKPHGPNIFSPRQKMDQSAQDLGSLGKHVSYDLSFRIETAQRTRRQGYSADSRRGIRVDQRAYWHAELAQPIYNGTKVEVLIEPFDSSLIYAHLGGRWLECIGARHPELRSMEEFSRWAQSAIDYFGKPFALATKRAADEHFVKRQRELWLPHSSVTPSVALSEKCLDDQIRKPTNQDVQAQDATTTSPAKISVFDRMRMLELKPLKVLAP